MTQAVLDEPTLQVGDSTAGTWSVVMSSGPELIGIATLARDHDGDYEVGLLVEDRWQQQGIGARLLHALAQRAANHGVERLTLYIQPGNHAMLATIRRAGLNARITTGDGLLRASIPTKTTRCSSWEPQSAAVYTQTTPGNPPTRASRRLRYDCNARHATRTSRRLRQRSNA